MAKYHKRITKISARADGGPPSSCPHVCELNQVEMKFPTHVTATPPIGISHQHLNSGITDSGEYVKFNPKTIMLGDEESKQNGKAKLILC